MTAQEKDRIECAIRHIQTAVDVDPWAKEIAVEAMKTQLSAEGTTSDLISRQAAIEAVDSEIVSTNPEHFKSSEKFIKFMDDADIASFGKWQWANGFNTAVVAAKIQFEKLPSAQPTLCGYDIEHLILIANVLRKENLPPERVIEALTDIGRIVSIVTDEFKESLRKAVEQCKI